MIALPEKVQSFAKWSGAKLRPKEKEVLEIDLPNFVDESEHKPAEEQESTESLVESKFKRNDAPWKNPKVTLATAVGVAAAVSAIGFFAVNSNLQWPSIGGPTLGTASNDDTEPVQHPDGKFQQAAITGPLGDGLDKDSNPTNPYTTTAKPADTKASKDAKGTKTGAKVAQTTTAPAAQSQATPAYRSTYSSTASSYPSTYPSTPTYHAPSRPAYTDYNDGAVSTSRTGYSRAAVTRSVATSSYTPSTTSTPSVSTSTSVNAAPAPAQKSAAERRAEVIAATTFNGASSSTQTVALAPPDAAGTSQPQQSKGTQYLAAEDAVLDGMPQQLINRAKRADGVLLQGLAFTPGDIKYLEDQEITAEISKPLDSGLPAGTQIICSIKIPDGQSQAQSAGVRLMPTAIVINGSEYPIPPGSAILNAKDGKPFIAKRGGSGFLRFLGSATKSVLSAGVGTLSSLTLGGNNILSSLTGLAGGASGGAANKATEALILPSNIPVQFSIIRPFAIPMASAEMTEPVALAQPSTDGTQLLSDAELMSVVHSSTVPAASRSALPMKEFMDVAQNLTDVQLRAIISQTEVEQNAQ